MKCERDVGAMAETTGLKWVCQKPDRKGGASPLGEVGNETSPPETVGLLTLERRCAGNDLDDFAGDGGLANAVHVQRQ